jgi:hypothetical protein
MSMKKWSDLDIIFLFENWYDGSREFLISSLNRSWKSIEKKAEYLGIKRGREPDQIEQIPDWLTGEMLSDGHYNNCGVYSHTTKYEEYAKFLSKKFNDKNIKTSYFYNSYFDKRTKKTYGRYLLKTRGVFRKERKRWYPNGKKIVPRDIKMSREMFFHMVLGDGCINANCNSLVVATMGFDTSDIIFLSERCNDIGMLSHINKYNNLYFSKINSSRNPSDFLGIDFPECYKYKIDRFMKWLN